MSAARSGNTRIDHVLRAAPPLYFMEIPAEHIGHARRGAEPALEPAVCVAVRVPRRLDEPVILPGMVAQPHQCGVLIRVRL